MFETLDTDKIFDYNNFSRYPSSCYLRNYTLSAGPDEVGQGREVGQKTVETPLASIVEIGGQNWELT